LFHKMRICKNRSLFESVHSFLDTDINVTVRGHKLIEIVLFANCFREILVQWIRMNSGSSIGEARRK
jgi:hypothetical protein